jgi:hypothetical protein
MAEVTTCTTDAGVDGLLPLQSRLCACARPVGFLLVDHWLLPYLQPAPLLELQRVA